jgi:hypothetical protein
MAIVALLGARFYNIPMLCLVIIWYVVDVILYIIFLMKQVDDINNVDGITEAYRYPIGSFVVYAVVAALWIYPHAGLILEIKRGIMSRETYPREEYSCCCVDKRRRY